MKSLNQAAIAVTVATLATVAGAHQAHDVVSYLNLLDSNATVREAHATNPSASMSKFGLNAAEQNAFLSEDKEAVARFWGIDGTIFPQIQIFIKAYTPV
jgi:hypothetical protein